MPKKVGSLSKRYSVGVHRAYFKRVRGGISRYGITVTEKSSGFVLTATATVLCSWLFSHGYTKVTFVDGEDGSAI